MIKYVYGWKCVWLAATTSMIVFHRDNTQSTYCSLKMNACSRFFSLVILNHMFVVMTGQYGNWTLFVLYVLRAPHTFVPNHPLKSKLISAVCSDYSWLLESLVKFFNSLVVILQSKSFGFAGTKDKRAVTTQRVINYLIFLILQYTFIPFFIFYCNCSFRDRCFSWFISHICF